MSEFLIIYKDPTEFGVFLAEKLTAIDFVQCVVKFERLKPETQITQITLIS